MSSAITAMLLMAPLASGAPAFGSAQYSVDPMQRAISVESVGFARARERLAAASTGSWVTADLSSFAPRSGGGDGNRGPLRRVVETVTNIVSPPDRNTNGGGPVCR